MKNILEKLIQTLQSDDKFVSEGNLLKNKIVESALSVDPALVKLLLSDNSIKKVFFENIDGILVFDKIKFQKFVSNKEFLPDSYTAYSNKIGLTTDSEFITAKREVVLSWPYKDCVLEGGQEDENASRNEIFWNSTIAPEQIDRLLSPKVLTNFKKYGTDGSHVPSEIGLDDNLIVRGNNLLSLYTLVEKYQSKIKLIYIDPPYNTEKDSFRYNDSFNHSSWLTFMRNRLEVAKKLLREDGVLIVQADDNEQAYLKVLLDEVMGADQFETSFYIQVRYGNKTLAEDNDFQKVMEVAHVYSKNTNIFKPNKLKENYSVEKFKYEIKELQPGEKIIVNGKTVEIFKENQYEIKEVEPHIDGLKETWATGSLIRQGGTAAEFLSKYLIQRKSEDGLKVLYKVYGMGEDGLGYRYIAGPKKEDAFRGKFYSGIPKKIKEDVNKGLYQKESPIPNFLYNFLQYEGDFGNCRAEGGVDIGGGKKPELLISFFIEYFTNTNDIVLDYHLGSGTTAAVALKMGRRFIGMEQLNYGEDDSVVRLTNVINGDQTGISKEYQWTGGGSFVYCELLKLNQLFVDKIFQAKNSAQLLSLWEEMKTQAFISYQIKPEQIEANVKDYQNLSFDNQKKFLLEILDKNMLYVPLSEIDDKTYKVSDGDKKLNKEFFQG